MLPTLSPESHHSTVLQHSKLLRDGRLGKSGSVDEVVDRMLAVTEDFEQIPSGPVGKDLKDVGHSYHMPIWIYICDSIWQSRVPRG